MNVPDEVGQRALSSALAEKVSQLHYSVFFFSYFVHRPMEIEQISSMKWK